MFSASHFQGHDEARKYLEALRWAGEPVCPHCGTVGGHYATKKPGVWRCHSKECRKDFSVTTKTVMEASHIKLNIWLQAFALMTASKKGTSAHQLHRQLGVTYKSAWFLAHRIRESMRNGGLLPPMGGSGKVIEADETYYGAPDKPRVSPRREKDGRPYKIKVRNSRPIVALVERGGSVRSFHVPVADAANVAKIVRDNVHRESRLHTDESRLYPVVGTEFAAHETVNHTAKEYARGDVTTNTVETYFSVFKRGMRGTYQHCKEKHLHRYLAEFDFRFNTRTALGFNDGERATLAIKGAEGKRASHVSSASLSTISASKPLGSPSGTTKGFPNGNRNLYATGARASQYKGPRMPELYAKADTLLAVKKSQTNSAEIHFQDSKGHMYVVDFPEALLGTLTATLAAVASQLRPSGHGQILTLTSGQIFHVDDGNVGLELTLNGTLRLPLIFQKSGIDDLRTALDELEARKGPDTKETAH